MSADTKKIYLRSFGCQMNDYDSARIIDLMRTKGYERIAEPDDADLVVIVTCSIREKAQEKTFSDLGRIRELKKLRPGMRIAVGGCVASQEGENILRRAPWVDVVFGPQTLQLLQLTQETGSLLAACRRVGISYSKGRGMIAAAEAQLGGALLVRQQGGASGGSSSIS